MSCVWHWWLSWYLKFKLKTGIKNHHWNSSSSDQVISATYSPKMRNMFLLPHVITNLTAVRRIYDCLSPLRQSPGSLLAISWLFPKHRRTGNDARILANYPRDLWFSYGWNVLLHMISLLYVVILFLLHPLKYMDGSTLFVRYVLLSTINYFNVQHFPQWLLPKFYFWVWS